MNRTEQWRLGGRMVWTLKDSRIPVRVNLAKFAGPEALRDCKTGDIKAPTQNIVWVSPEGTGGPNYVNM